MRLRPILSVTLTALSLVLAAGCGFGPAKTAMEPDLATAPISASTISDCAALPPAPQTMEYNVTGLKWERDYQLSVSGELLNTPRDHGVWAFLRDEYGTCYRFSFGNFSNLVARNAGPGFTFGAMTHMPDIIDRLPADNGVCPHEYVYNPVSDFCEVPKSRGYNVVLVLTTPAATDILANYTPIPHTAAPISSFPPGSRVIIPDSLTSTGYLSEQAS